MVVEETNGTLEREKTGRHAAVAAPKAKLITPSFAPGMDDVFDQLWIKLKRRLGQPLDETDLVYNENGEIRNGSLRSIVMTSWDDRAGSSTISLGTAARAASMDLGGVCLVDADLSARRLTLAAGLGEQPGLRELLEGSASSMEDLIVHVPGSKLSFLPAGCLTDVPPLTEVRVQEIISELEDRFRYVFFDTPAIKRGVDAYRWGKYIGNAVLVVPAETSRRHSVVHAVNTMRLHGLHLLGVVLNRRVYPIPKWLYRFL